jgi:hypothetical protein
MGARTDAEHGYDYDCDWDKTHGGNGMCWRNSVLNNQDQVKYSRFRFTKQGSDGRPFPVSGYELFRSPLRHVVRVCKWYREITGKIPVGEENH